MVASCVMITATFMSLKCFYITYVVASCVMLEPVEVTLMWFYQSPCVMIRAYPLTWLLCKTYQLPKRPCLLSNVVNNWQLTECWEHKDRLLSWSPGGQNSLYWKLKYFQQKLNAKCFSCSFIIHVIHQRIRCGGLDWVRGKLGRSYPTSWKLDTPR